MIKCPNCNKELQEGEMIYVHNSGMYLFVGHTSYQTNKPLDVLILGDIKHEE